MKNSMQMRTNIINQQVARKIQQQALHVIADSVKMSFGPKGSMTAITDYLNKENQQGIIIKHTKDGHTIISNIKFLNPIERSVQDLIVDMTRYIVKDVGDGTTSAAILSSLIFDEFCRMEFDKSLCSSEIIQEFSKRVKLINDEILSKARECTLEDIYNICLISTNGNKDLTDTLYEIYKKFGREVYINIDVSPREINIVKEYDGMTLETGLANTAFINDRSNNSARVQKPRIYIFQDPIDTPEMISYFNAIIDRNIMNPLKAMNRPSSPQQKEISNQLIPTVILCKRITPDISSYLETLIQLMHSNPGAIPFILVSDIHQEYMLEDILQMTGAKWIKKYLDPEVQKSDQEQGLAPTIDNVHEWYGTADEVRSDQYKTQFIRPAVMFNEDGSYSDKYNMMLNYLSSQIEKATNEGAGVNEVATLKRRYNSFKGNMVDFLVGGITLSDREALKAALEDAVYNVRSAVANGVGYGSNFMAYSTIKELLSKEEYSHDIYLNLLHHAYFELLVCLYKNSFPMKYEEIIKESLIHNCPLNIRTKEYDYKVLSSIKSDVVILETINKIVTMMYITNQYLLPNVAINAYDNID